MKQRYKGLAIATGFGVMILTMATPAHATLEVQIGGTVIGGVVTGGTICQDNTACDSDASVGKISWADGTNGTITIDSTGASSGNKGGGTTLGFLTMQLDGTPAGSFMISVTDNGFNTPPPPLTLTQTANSLAKGTFFDTGNVNATGYFSQSGTLFDVSGPATGVASSSLQSLTGGEAVSNAINGTSPYGLTEVINVTITTSGPAGLSISADLAANAVPEPASIGLLGGLLLLSVGAIRRKARRA